MLCELHPAHLCHAMKNRILTKCQTMKTTNWREQTTIIARWYYHYHPDIALGRSADCNISKIIFLNFIQSMSCIVWSNFIIHFHSIWMPKKEIHCFSLVAIRLPQIQTVNISCSADQNLLNIRWLAATRDYSFITDQTLLLFLLLGVGACSSSRKYNRTN